MPKTERKMLVVQEARVEDVGKRIARIHPQDMGEIDLAIGDVIEVIGSHKTVAKMMPTTESHRDRRTILIDGITREAWVVCLNALDEFANLLFEV